jgi:hypothetical protein
VALHLTDAVALNVNRNKALQTKTETEITSKYFIIRIKQWQTITILEIKIRKTAQDVTHKAKGVANHKVNHKAVAAQ